MHVNFHWIKWKNLLSTGNTFITIDFEEHKARCFVGKNGAGKSTILDALCFVLFNQAFRDINKDQLINSVNNKELVVELEFSIADDRYKIVRGSKPSIFEIYKNNTLIESEASSVDHQKYLENEVLHMNFKSFCQIIILGTAEYTSFVKLKPEHRRKVIENIIPDIDVVTAMNELAKKDKKELEEEIYDLSKTIDKYEMALQIEKRHEEENKANNETAKRKILNDIYWCERGIGSKNTKLTEQKDQYNQLVQQFKQKIDPSVEAKKYENAIAKIDAELGILKKDIYFLEHNETCPTCKQTIEGSFKTESVDEKKKRYDEYAAKKVRGSAKLKELNVQVAEYNKQSKDILQEKQNITILENEIKNDTNFLQRLNSQFDSLNVVVTVDREKIVELEQKIEEAKDKKSNLQQRLEVLVAAIMILKEDGFKAEVMKNYMSVLNDKINEFLAILNFHIDFRFDEQFDISIQSQYRTKFSYASFSAGERFRINIAILFALRAIAKMKNSVSANILILDEILDSSLDADGEDDCFQILKVLLQDTNYIVISHQVETIDRFDVVMQFQKIKDFSQISTRQN